VRSEANFQLLAWAMQMALRIKNSGIRWEQASSYLAVRLESAPITTKRNPDVIRDFYEHRPVCREKLRLLEDFASS
jgi:hypothetical protein